MANVSRPVSWQWRPPATINPEACFGAECRAENKRKYDNGYIDRLEGRRKPRAPSASIGLSLPTASRHAGVERRSSRHGRIAETKTSGPSPPSPIHAENQVATPFTGVIQVSW